MFTLAVNLPRIKKVREQGTVAVYEIEPLDSGYGVTLGPAIQRALLCSLSGTAITAIRVEGAQGDGQTIPRVKEEIAEIVLNV